jgi:hypothetical protein
LSRPKRTSVALLVAVLLAAGIVVAQQQRFRRAPITVDPTKIERGNIPRWDVDPAFPKDVFRFARIQYTTAGAERSSRAWWTDFPDADLNISWRLAQLTSMKVDPDPIVIELTDDRLFDHPFIFMSGAIAIELSEAEVVALRRYLRNGGFLMVDDFWGDENWENFYGELKRVLPERDWEELPLEHPIFHCVFKLTEKPQIPNVGVGRRSQYDGVTWEGGADTMEPHYRAIKDDKGRIMVLMCHNTDLGDGWEEEATDPYYFKEFSEKKAYPLGINIVYYVMTH